MNRLDELNIDREIPAAQMHIPEEDIRSLQAEIGDILRTGQLVLGSRTKKFEGEFAEIIGKKHAVAVSSGSAALEIALRALNIEGKKVIVPANTFYATAAAVLHAGGKLQIVDVDRETWSLSPDIIAKNMDEETAGVIAVHIGGMVTPDMDRIAALCRERGNFVMEDAAHAHGSRLGERQAGSLSDVSAFSFFPTKVITSVEGGILVTDDDALAKEAKIFRDQGKASCSVNLHTHAGSAWRMSEINALVGLSQLRRLDEFIIRRKSIAAVYDEELGQSTNVHVVKPGKGTSSNYYKYPVILREGINRDILKEVLKKQFRVHLSGEVYSVPLHMQPVFQGKFEGGPFPIAEYLCASQICLPISAVMTDEEAKYVARSLEMAINQTSK